MSVGAEGRTAPPPDPEVVKLKRWMDESLQLPRAIIVGLQDVIAQAGSMDVMETYALQVPSAPNSTPSAGSRPSVSRR